MVVQKSIFIENINKKRTDPNTHSRKRHRDQKSDKRFTAEGKDEFLLKKKIDDKTAARRDNI
jgi:hypothetical protein